MKKTPQRSRPDDVTKAPRKTEVTKVSPSSWAGRFGWWLLIAVPFAVYAATLSYKITQLDDVIFIFSKDDFNQSFGNIARIFSIGVFSEKDIYFRPLFLATFIIERLFVDLDNTATALRLYHFTNIALHVGCVLSLFQLLKRVGVMKTSALWLALLFAVHPALTMAVAWIPGRNDTMLTLFALAFFIQLHKYVVTKAWKHLSGQAVFLALALFTKETAVFIPFAAALFIWSLGEKLFDKRYVKAYATWLPIGFLWFVLRQNVLDKNQDLRSLGDMASDAIGRLPAYFVYLGKAVFPFNLSVFPSLENASLSFGAAAVALIGLLLWFTHARASTVTKATHEKRMWTLGAGWFFIFITPFLLVPPNVNDQVFEHRLYLPMCGLMILFGHTFLFNGGLRAIHVAVGGALVTALFCVLTVRYLPLFKAPIPFWENAVAASPNSSYAHKLLGARYSDAKMKDKALVQFRKAYALNKDEKHARYFIARDELAPAGKTDEAIALLREEIKINPTYTEAYFELSHLYFQKNALDSTKKYLLFSRERQPVDGMINNNLLLTLIRLGDKDGAAAQVQYMKQNGLTVDAQVERQVADMQP